MTRQKKKKSKLLSLVDNSLVQFLLSLFLIALLTQAANGFKDIYLVLLLKTIGYGLFFYLGTPFLIHWLIYVSTVKLTRLKMGITIFVVGIYGYIFWDSYFSYREIFRKLLFPTDLISLIIKT